MIHLVKQVLCVSVLAVYLLVRVFTENTGGASPTNGYFRQGRESHKPSAFHLSLGSWLPELLVGEASDSAEGGAWTVFRVTFASIVLQILNFWNKDIVEIFICISSSLCFLFFQRYY